MYANKFNTRTKINQPRNFGIIITGLRKVTNTFPYQWLYKIIATNTYMLNIYDFFNILFILLQNKTNCDIKFPAQ